MSEGISAAAVHQIVSVSESVIEVVGVAVVVVGVCVLQFCILFGVPYRCFVEKRCAYTNRNEKFSNELRPDSN